MIANDIIEIEEQEDGVYVFPNSKRFPPTWALYIFNDGRADLYTKRASSGALLGKPIALGTPKDFQTCQVRLAKGSVDFTGGYRDPNPGRMCGKPATKRVDLSDLVFVPKGDFYVWMCPEHDKESTDAVGCNHDTEKISVGDNRNPYKTDNYVCKKCKKEFRLIETGIMAERIRK